MNQWAQQSAIKAASIHKASPIPERVENEKAQASTRGKMASLNKSKGGQDQAKSKGKVPLLVLPNSMMKPLAPPLATERFSRKLPLLGAVGLKDVFGLDSGTSPIQMPQKTPNATLNKAWEKKYFQQDKEHNKLHRKRVKATQLGWLERAKAAELQSKMVEPAKSKKIVTSGFLVKQEKTNEKHCKAVAERI